MDYVRIFYPTYLVEHEINFLRNFGKPNISLYPR